MVSTEKKKYNPFLILVSSNLYVDPPGFHRLIKSHQNRILYLINLTADIVVSYREIKIRVPNILMSEILLPHKNRELI